MKRIRVGRSRCLLVCVLALGVISSSAVAQAIGSGGRPGQPGAPRRQVEARLQQRVDAIVRQRLQLNDEQFGKLQELNGRLEIDRRAIRNEERDVRMALRQELMAGSNANESRIAELLDKLPMVERRRIGLLEQEQRELSRFLSPSQRARYFALQDELRRNMQELQRRRMGPPPGDGVGDPRDGRGIRGTRPPGVTRPPS